jgi:hypothetical protein
MSRPGRGAVRRSDGFGQLLHSEWIKFRTVRGWVIGMIVAAILTILLGVFAAGGGGISCQQPGRPPQTGKACLPYVPHGPGGEVVTDSFNFARQPLTGNGTITARLIALTGKHVDLSSPGGTEAGSGPGLVPGLAPWSKAGLVIKQSLHQGSAYAAMTVTGGHGVRMQWNYTGDTAGLPGRVTGTSPRWLRLTRAGDVITGYDSADGSHWTKVGTVHLAGLPATVQVGLFATSPNYSVTSQSFGGSSERGGPSEATGVFDHVRLSGAAASGRWSETAIGSGGPAALGPVSRATGFSQAHGIYTLTGSGDIAPVVPGPGSMLPTATVEQSLSGAFLGLIAIVVVATMFFTAEYRRGLIRTTFAATPHRGQVLAAKAVVGGAVAFVTGLVASVIAIAIGVPLETSQGQVVLPVSALTEARVVIGTAALLAVAAVLAVALGGALRRSAAAVTLAIVTVVLPFLLTALKLFPPAIGSWLLRVTPAAGLAIQQSIPRYPQVATTNSPAGGYYPLPPFAGFAVLCCWAAAALALAYFLMRRRDV